MDNRCRICLAVDVKLLSLYFTEDQCSLSEMFTYLTNLSIDAQDGLPSTVCAPCKSQLIQSYEFKLKCITSDQALKSLGGKIKEEDTEWLTNKDEFEEKLPPIDMKVEEQEVSDVQYLEEFSEHSNDSTYLILTEQPKVKDKKESPNNPTKKRKTIKLNFDQLEFVNENSGKKYVCTICNKKFGSMVSLRHHMKKGHSGTEEPYSCKICKQTLGCDHDLKVHMSLHNRSDSGWKCNQCNKEFKGKTGIRRHIMRHMKGKQYGCDLCDKMFSELYALNRHMRVHTGIAPEKQHACEICDKKFAEKRSLMLHMRVHTGERPCVCAECGKDFPSERLLRSHQRVHSELRPYACKYCDRRFRHESSRTTHHRTHTGEKPYVCSYCGKTFIQNSNLTLHLRVHTGAKPHKCETCGHEFASSSSLKVHIRCHTGEKPYSCKVCGRKFARTDMKAHMRVHTGERPHQCNVCLRRFSKLAVLNDHCRVHTGETPYECTGCSQKFRTKSDLRKHVVAHKKKKKSKQATKPAQEKATEKKPTQNVSKDKIINVIDTLEETNKNINATNNIIYKIKPLDERPQEIILRNECDVKNELVVINNAGGELCLSSNELTSNFVDSMNLVAVNEGDINISASNTLQGPTVSLYQVDQSLVQIHSGAGSVTISKITSKVTTNF